MDEKAVVVVGICTCRNPAGLAKLLTNLAEVSIDRPPDRVVVVDNDSGGAGLAAAQSMMAGLPFRLTVTSEPQPGIPFARNRMIAEVLKENFDYLAMLDDDEYPAPGWLEALEAEAKASRADVVGGPVLPRFAAPLQWPLTDEDFTKKGGHLDRGETRVFSTANVLLSRRLIERWRSDLFRTAYAESGSCDTEFFRRTAKAGHRHAIAPNAFVFEDIPPERARVPWVLRRRRRAGNALARVRRTQDSLPVVIISEGARMAALVLLALVDFARAPTNARARLRAKMKLARAAGKLSGLLGMRDREYTAETYRTIDAHTKFRA